MPSKLDPAVQSRINIKPIGYDPYGGGANQSGDGEMDHTWNPSRPVSCQTWGGQNYGIWQVDDELLGSSNCGNGTSQTWCSGCYEGYFDSNANTISGCAPWWVFSCDVDWIPPIPQNVVAHPCFLCHDHHGVSDNFTVQWDQVQVGRDGHVTYNVYVLDVPCTDCSCIADDMAFATICPDNAVECDDSEKIEATGISADEIDDYIGNSFVGVKCYRVTSVAEDGTESDYSVAAYVSQCGDTSEANPNCQACCRGANACWHELAYDCANNLGNPGTPQGEGSDCFLWSGGCAQDCLPCDCPAGQGLDDCNVCGGICDGDPNNPPMSDDCYSCDCVSGEFDECNVCNGPGPNICCDGSELCSSCYSYNGTCWDDVQNSESCTVDQEYCSGAGVSLDCNHPDSPTDGGFCYDYCCGGGCGSCTERYCPIASWGGPENNSCSSSVQEEYGYFNCRTMGCDGACSNNKKVYDCAGGCGGYAQVDSCGVCQGDGSTCGCESGIYDINGDCCPTDCNGVCGASECVANCNPSGGECCCYATWIGDGYADCEDQEYGCDLTCYDNDGGDCDVDDCVNDDSTADSYGDYCSDMGDNQGYDSNPAWCGGYDGDSTYGYFCSLSQCCICGGGSTGNSDPSQCGGGGGDICEWNYSIATLPYSNTASNVGTGDDYDVSGGDGEDFVYKITFGTTQTGINVSLCNPGTNYDAKLEIFDSNCNSTGNYNDDSSCFNFNPNAEFNPSMLTGMTFSAGTYYIVVDGYNGATGQHEICVGSGGDCTSTDAGVGSDDGGGDICEGNGYSYGDTGYPGHSSGTNSEEHGCYCYCQNGNCSSYTLYGCDSVCNGYGDVCVGGSCCEGVDCGAMWCGCLCG